MRARLDGAKRNDRAGSGSPCSCIALAIRRRRTRRASKSWRVVDCCPVRARPVPSSPAGFLACWVGSVSGGVGDYTGDMEASDDVFENNESVEAGARGGVDVEAVDRDDGSDLVDEELSSAGQIGAVRRRCRRHAATARRWRRRSVSEPGQLAVVSAAAPARARGPDRWSLERRGGPAGRIDAVSARSSTKMRRQRG